VRFQADDRFVVHNRGNIKPQTNALAMPK